MTYKLARGLAAGHSNLKKLCQLPLKRNCSIRKPTFPQIQSIFPFQCVPLVINESSLIVHSVRQRGQYFFVSFLYCMCMINTSVFLLPSLFLLPPLDFSLQMHRAFSGMRWIANFAVIQLPSIRSRVMLFWGNESQGIVRPTAVTIANH